MAVYLIILIPWLTFIALRVFEDYWLYKSNEVVNHKHNAICVVAVSSMQNLAFTYYVINGNLIDLAYNEFMLWLIYWLLFDILYNKSIGQKTQFIGTTADLDILLSKYSFGQPIAFKLICVVVLNSIYYYKEIILWIMDIVAW